MDICKSLLKRLGLILGALVLLPVAAAVMVALVGVLIPLCIIAVIIGAVTMSDESLNDCFTVKEVDDMIID